MIAPNQSAIESLTWQLYVADDPAALGAAEPTATAVVGAPIEFAPWR